MSLWWTAQSLCPNPWVQEVYSVSAQSVRVFVSISPVSSMRPSKPGDFNFKPYHPTIRYKNRNFISYHFKFVLALSRGFKASMTHSKYFNNNNMGNFCWFDMFCFASCKLATYFKFRKQELKIYNGFIFSWMLSRLSNFSVTYLLLVASFFCEFYHQKPKQIQWIFPPQNTGFL